MNIPDDQWAALVKAVEEMDEVGKRMICKTCGRAKQPIGRSAPVDYGWCSDHTGCQGYRTDPYPKSLWPGERLSEFGYGYFDAARVLPVFRAMLAIQGKES